MAGLLGAGIPLLVGALFLVIGINLLRGARRLRRDGASARATVVGFQTRSQVDSNRMMYTPVLQWVTADGRTVEVTSSSESSSVGDLRRGGEVTVFYDPDNPRRMLIDGFDGNFLAGIFCFFGAAALVGGIAVACVDLF
ncbi:DUF3592 domain-containing protein [Streptomyces sp. NPDC005573]|uniref:DUF3592 domain-containing protein n=1 Tax=Streptomyces sp. NPDC005573 TaxID=3156890 RepID=UPI0033B50AF5